MRIRMFPEYSRKFTSQEYLYRYLYGGRSIVTLVSPTGNFHTYSYEKPRNAEDFPEDIRFVFAIHTDDADSSVHTKFYLGMIENDKFRVTRNSRFRADAPVVRGAFYIDKLRKSQKFLDNSPMSIFHEGVCGLCGSKIWAKKSLECGFGRSCRKEMELPSFSCMYE